jgi:RsiW-degrading membrane proteinase PrsW (M82 family)
LLNPQKIYLIQIPYQYTKYYFNGDEVDIQALNSLSDTLPFVNFMKGIYYDQHSNYEEAEKHFLIEEQLNPSFDLAIKFLHKIYDLTDSDSIHTLMMNSERSAKLAYSTQTDYHFLQGNWGRYFSVILTQRLSNVGLFTLVAAFLVSFIWLVFLRTMDIFNRERWSDIFVVFILGSLFTYLCLPIYDYADLVLNWSINGEAVNDFFYCAIVIGGGEEIVKLIPWLLFGLLTRKLKEPFDYILYASVAALGFSFVENLMYLENYHNIVVRSIMSTVGHMFDATIVAYAFIIVRFRLPKDSPWKALVLISGFALALFAHGFYDYWLISPAAANFQWITVLFFIFSLRVWFYFKNNAMNHSPYFKGNYKFRLTLQQDILTISMIVMLVLEFTLMSLEIGAMSSYGHFYKSGIFIGIFVLFISSELDGFKLEKGIWNRFEVTKKMEFKGFSKMLNFISETGYKDFFRSEDNNESLEGLQLRLFAPKTNVYVGKLLPVSGVCVRKVEVGNNPNWYVFKLNSPIQMNNYVQDYIILKSKSDTQSLTQDKVEIYFMFIPDASLLLRSKISIESLRYAGRVYSRVVG